MTQYLQQDAIGAVIELTITEDGEPIDDLASASSKVLVFKKPDGTVVSKTASFSTDGTDAKLRYVTEADFLDQSGDRWQVQAALTIGTFTGRTKPETFTVKPNLS